MCNVPKRMKNRFSDFCDIQFLIYAITLNLNHLAEKKYVVPTDVQCSENNFLDQNFFFVAIFSF